MERYLNSVSSRLTDLPADERDDQMREIRQHLESLVADQRAYGLDQDEAVAAALNQFGGSDQIGKQLRHASKQRRLPNLWLYVGIYLSAVILTLGVFITANDKPTDFPYGLANQVILALVLPAGTLAIGLISYYRAKRFRRRT